MSSGPIVIVGGGIIGCSTAYYLSKLGVTDLTLIEAVDVAHAASGRAGGFLAVDWCDRGHTGLLARRSYQLHSILASELGRDCGYRTVNTFSVGMDERGGKEGLPGWVDGGVGGCNVIGTEYSTAQVHPALLTRALMEVAQSRGVKLVKGRVVGGNVSDDGQVEGVVMEDGSVLPAVTVVLCMGPWTNAGLEMFGVNEKVVTGTRAHSIVIKLGEENKDLVDNTALFISENKGDEPEVYPRPDGTVYICGGGKHKPLPDDPSRVEIDNSDCDHIKHLGDQVSSVLRDAKEYTRSACYLPHSSDGRPLVGPVPGRSGLWLAAGHACWGILQGPATGEGLADMIVTGQARQVDMSKLDPARLIKIDNVSCLDDDQNMFGISSELDVDDKILIFI